MGAMSTALTATGLTKTFHLGFLGALRPFRALAARTKIKGMAYHVDAVRGVDVEVQRGEIYGFLGPNGAGKTTTIKMLLGLVHPSAGSGTLLGQPLGSKDARAQIGYLPEHPYFYDHLLPLEFLDFYGKLFSMSAQERRSRSLELIERVGLSHAMKRPIRKFSKGMVQRLGLAQALINTPQLVILDEPLSGLDPMGRKDVRDIIYDLKSRGATVFFSSHILQDVEMICDRVGILVNGQLRHEGALTELLENDERRSEISVRQLSDEQEARYQANPDMELRRVAAGWELVVSAGSMQVEVLKELSMGGTEITRVAPVRRSLEEFFVNETRQGEGA